VPDAAPHIDPAVEVSDLVVRHGDLTAVDQLSFTVASGSITALLGPNGAGKTTTVETLEGYRHPTAGTVRVLGLDPVDDHARLVPRIGVMLQEGGIQSALRPGEAVHQYAGFFDDPLDPIEVLDRVGLTERARSAFRTLSGGERQRLSLALALIGRPVVAFLDEPTAGIDPAGKRLIRSVIRELRDEGVTVVLTTHDLEEVERLADEVVIIDRGHLLAAGPPQVLMSAGGADLSFSAPPDLDVDGLASVLGVAVHEAQPGDYQVAAEGSPRLVAELTSWLADQDLPLGDLRAGRQRLEDVFLRLVADAAFDDGMRRERRR
jgi:ABC-2 type transport system ATP-binding protein